MSEKEIFQNQENPQVSFQDVSFEVISNVTEVCVGFNILDPYELAQNGVPEVIVNPLIKNHIVKSSLPNVKTIIRGIRGFDLLNKICDDLEIDKSSQYGFKDDGNLAIEYKEKISSFVNTRRNDVFLSSFLRGINIDY